VSAVPAARRVPLLLAGWCGLRSGEVRGLRVEDLDVQAGVVHVRQAIVRLTGQAYSMTRCTSSRLPNTIRRALHLGTGEPPPGVVDLRKSHPSGGSPLRQPAPVTDVSAEYT